MFSSRALTLPLLAGPSFNVARNYGPVSATLPAMMRHFVLSKKQLALCILSGIIPGLAFYVERVTMASPVQKEVTQ